MNAYELADELQETEPYYSTDYKLFDKSANMLRQQADRIAELEKEKIRAYDNGYEDGRKHNTQLNTQLHPQIKELSDGCGNCHACLVGVMENHMPVTSQRMIVCSDCGNKRCPKASNHRHKCTGSNEVGQYGSIYTAPKELSDEEILNVAFCCEINTVAIENDWDGTVIDFAKAILKKASEK